MNKDSKPLRQSPEQLHHQGRQAIAAGQYAEAETLFRRLVEIQPGDAYFLATLGQILCWRYRRKHGMEYLNRAATLLEKQAAKSGNTRFLLELAGQMLHWGNIVCAERLSNLALKLQPDDTAAQYHLLMLLTRTNRNQEALPYARRICEKQPRHPGSNILLAMIESDLGQRDEARRRLEQVIADNLEREQTARAYNELAVILDKQGQYSAAFKALQQASAINAQLPQNQAVSHSYVFDCLDKYRNGFDHALLNRWPAAELCNDKLPAPAFLIGFLRSGTTLTEQVLGAHPGIIATDESSIIHELSLELANISGIINDTPQALKSIDIAQARALRQFFWQRMREEYGEQVMKKRLIDKNALNTIDLGLISSLFPEARILFALRDPRDVCISCFMQSFTATPATVNLLSWPGIIRQYTAVMNYWLYLREQMPSQYLQLRYEDCVTDFETSYRQVFEFLGVEWRDEVLRYHQRAKQRYISTPSFAAVSRPIYQTAVARWKRYESSIQDDLPQVHRLITAFGYD
jgi:Flp pilus assembly protein TadD